MLVVYGFKVFLRHASPIWTYPLSFWRTQLTPAYHVLTIFSPGMEPAALEWTDDFFFLKHFYLDLKEQQKKGGGIFLFFE